MNNIHIKDKLSTALFTSSFFALTIFLFTPLKIYLTNLGNFHFYTNALALLFHSLAIAAFFADNCIWAIFEFVPKTDTHIKRLLSSRKDIFTDYTRENFEKIFGKFFKIHSQTKIKETERTVYLMEKLI